MKYPVERLKGHVGKPAWCLHHEGTKVKGICIPLEFLIEPIENQVAYAEAWKAYAEAWKAYDEAGKAYDEAGKAYVEAIYIHREEIMALFRKERPDVKWDDVWGLVLP